MPSTTRRALLATLGSAGIAGLAGCRDLGLRGTDDPPAGSLRFECDHTVPHTVAMRVTGVGTAPGDGPSEVTGDPVVPRPQRELTASTVLEPGERQVYEGVFTEAVWYGVTFTLDGELPDHEAGQVQFYPAPTDGERGAVLGARIDRAGVLSWVISSSADPGPFDE